MKDTVKRNQHAVEQLGKAIEKRNIIISQQTEAVKTQLLEQELNYTRNQRILSLNNAVSLCDSVASAEHVVDIAEKFFDYLTQDGFATPQLTSLELVK